MTVVSALKKNRKKLLRLPDVTSVGVGQKNGKDVILVFVKRGGAQMTARSADTIPQTVDGYEVDIHEEIKVG
jgi:hypothetical protein